MPPPVIGHRGAASLAPENTLAGVRAAAAAGARWVEFDVRLTRDDQCILLHDTTLRRTAGQRRRVASVTFDEISGLDAGSWFGAQFADERVPTLEETLDLAARLGLGANIEIKPDPARNDRVARCVVDVLRHAAPLPVLVSSLDETMLAAVRRLDPDVRLGLVARRRRREWRDLARRLDLFSFSCRDSSTRRGDVDAYRAAGLVVLVFTVNDPARAAELFGWGVTGVFSDSPDRLVPRLVPEPTRRAS